MYRADFVANVALSIILSFSKPLSEKPLLIDNMKYQSFLTLKALMIRLGNTEFLKTYMTLVFEVVSPFLFQPSWINVFFRVRVGNTVSGAREQEMGVPQGCILSVTLFSVKINGMVKAICPGVDCSLYIDDFVICFRSRNMNIIERQLQQCLNKQQTWSEENGFKFSKSKTKCMHICNLTGVQPDPELYLDKTKIEVVSEFKFLGVIFSKKLSFLPHITALKKKCKKALNLLKIVAHSEWGADRKVLLRLNRSLIRSKLDYGSVVYGSARKSYLKILDSIHNEGLRLVLGAFRTFPINSLYVEADEPSLSYRRQKLSLQYF